MTDLFAPPTTREIKKRRKARAVHQLIVQIMTDTHNLMVREHRARSSGKFHIDEQAYMDRVAKEILKHFIKKPNERNPKTA